MGNTSSAVSAAGKAEQGPFYDLDSFQLPAAGAYTSQAYSAIPAEARRLSVVATYAKAAAAASGGAALRLQWKVAGNEEGPIADVFETILAAGTPAAPFDAVPQYILQVNTPSTTTSVSYRAFDVAVPVDALGVRVLAAEVVDTVHPGVLTTRLYTSSHR